MGDPEAHLRGLREKGRFLGSSPAQGLPPLQAPASHRPWGGEGSETERESHRCHDSERPEASWWRSIGGE